MTVRQHISRRETPTLGLRTSSGPETQLPLLGSYSSPGYQGRKIWLAGSFTWTIRHLNNRLRNPFRQPTT